MDMKTIFRALIALLLAAMPALASAQILQNASQRLELAVVETEIGEHQTAQLEVFKMNDAGTYWLSVGHLGIGSDLVQLEFDPVFELFIPLGNSLEEALAKMKELQAFYKEPRLATMEVQGCLAALYPGEELETVTITSRRLLASKILSFSLQRDDFVRATYINKSDFGSLVFSLKAYKALHPKEK